MSSTNVRRDRRGVGQPVLDWLLIVSCLPVIVVGAVVFIISGGLNLSFFIPAILVGAMLGMLLYVSVRDRTTS